MDRLVHSSVVFASDLISQLGADLLAVRLVLSVGESPLWPPVYWACPAARCAKRTVILMWLTARLVTTLSANGGVKFSIDQRRRRVIRLDAAMPNPNAGGMIANLADCRHLDFVIRT
jgi:hypothetical protein